MSRETPAERAQIDQIRRMLKEVMRTWHHDLGFKPSAIVSALKEGPMP